MKINIILLRGLIITAASILIMNAVLYVTAAGILTYVAINLLIISIPVTYYTVDWDELKEISNK